MKKRGKHPALFLVLSGEMQYNENIGGIAMKVVVALDSLKDCMGSLQAGEAVRLGILEAIPEAEVVVKPLADGGEGTAEALITGMRGTKKAVTVTGPLGVSISSFYGYLSESKTAVIEIAAAAGIEHVPPVERNPLNTTTYGVGELIRHAAENGARHFIIGLGGSATNDCGLGMLQALGFEFLDASGSPVGLGGGELKNVAAICRRRALPELKECSFEVACDVINPLCGKNGASAVYGPQKGATPSMVQQLEEDCRRFADAVEQETGMDCRSVPGAGAAGGLGFAFLSFLNARLKPGISIVLEQLEFEQELKSADFLVTGEGKLDAQTAMGKAPSGIARLAKEHGIPVIALGGALAEDAGECNCHGIDALFSIANAPMSLQEALAPETAERNLRKTAEQVFRLIRAVKK